MTRVDLEGMRAAGAVAAALLARLGEAAQPGVSTGAVDRLARAWTAEAGAVSSQYGYHGFPAHICTSRNAVVCHGIPRDDEVLADGDLVNVDVTVAFRGWVGDCSATFCVGRPSSEARRLVDVARRCRDASAVGARLRPARSSATTAGTASGGRCTSRPTSRTSAALAPGRCCGRAWRSPSSR